MKFNFYDLISDPHPEILQRSAHAYRAYEIFLWEAKVERNAKIRSQLIHAGLEQLKEYFRLENRALYEILDRPMERKYHG
jgi:hypothetical protein